MAKLESSTEVQGDNGHRYRRGEHPNSQANLPKGQWKSGQSGNPAGRKSYGAHTSEWVNSMATWSLPQLDEVIEDTRAESAKVAAAQQVKAARMGNGNAFNRCCDRTEGRPRQSLDQTITDGRDVREQSNSEFVKNLSPEDQVALWQIFERGAGEDPTVPPA